MEFNFRIELGKMTPKIAEGAKIYIFGAGAHWESICKIYKYLVNINIDDYIDGFIDNDQNKQRTLFHNKPVYALVDIDVENSVILISVITGGSIHSISWQLLNAGMLHRHSFFTPGCFMTILLRWEYLRLMQFKNKHKGQRCFIIGNGPSLASGDLDQLKSELTFATNKIYLLFNKTEWRPSYYVIADDVIIKNIHTEIEEKITCPKFYAYNTVFDIENFMMTDGYFYYLDGRADLKPEPFSIPAFSEEPFMLQWGATVTYDCIQLAAYMGFDEIYLLGVDHSFPLAIKNNGEIIQKKVGGHFSPIYGETIYNAQIDISNAAYKTARAYAEQHDIKIYNATRGGELKIFEHVNFDKLF